MGLFGATFLLGLLLASPPSSATVSAEESVKAAVAKGDVEAAVAALRSATSELEVVGRTDPGGAAQRLDDLASLVLPLSPDAARTAAEAGRAWRARAFTPAGAEVAKSWSLLATIAYTTGDWKSAEASARKALAIKRTADDTENLAVILMMQGRLADAEPAFVDAIGMRRAAGDPAKLAESLNGYAELLRQRDRPEAAAKTFDDAVKIAAPLADSDPLLLARLETNRAGLAKDRGRLGEAEEGVRRSIAIKEKAVAAGIPADLS
ncbi:MAG TPA: tetratricopeptide repeat protein, partial [Candidatus Polarisedimenticolaceae bacterium]|nr:tetratricopeptide repeat protein [Candidatus Polarisedimenticolaceae bacterium]